MLTVANLIKILNEQDPADVVVMSIDEEGNNYLPLKEWETGYYDQFHREVSEENRQGSSRALILYPGH